MVEQGHRPVGGEERLTPQGERLEEVFLKLRILEGVPVTSVAGDVATRFLSRDCSAVWTAASCRRSEGCC